MRGIVGLVHFDQAPVDRELLTELTESLAVRGSDRRRILIDGAVGLGYAELAMADEPKCDEQPFALDGDVWIVADARLDGRSELVDRLEASGREGVRSASDAKLILHAYRVWGESSPAYLLGDFSFAIWDRSQRRLFCARDHFGIKPFYYVDWPGGFVFSNSVGCLRQHPAVTTKLNELAIADYLLFWWNMDPEATSFADIRRLPAAHTLSRSSSDLATRRYWDFPIEDAVENEPAQGWVERFRSVLRTAVDDRLPTDPVAVAMSGGLDSTTIAAIAQGLYSDRGRHSHVHCHTLGYDRLIPDQEGRYARLVAAHLSMPYCYQPLDDYRLTERWGELPVPSEPGDHFRDAIVYDYCRRVAAGHRVVLTGQGGDPILSHLSSYFLQQLSRFRIHRAAQYLAGGIRRTGRLPPLGIWNRWARWRDRKLWRQGYPSWLDPDFEARLDLQGRWRWFHLESRPKALNPSHPGAHSSLMDVFWANCFEREGAWSRALAIEHRHPLLDLRVVELLLKVPPVPWCVDKYLLREAMRDLLPDAVRNRPKVPLVASPKHSSFEPLRQIWEAQVERVPEVGNYVRPERIVDELKRHQATDLAVSDSICQPIQFAYWFQNSI